MKIQADGFSRNGAAKFVGVLKAVRDDGSSTSFNRKVDVYDPKNVETFIVDMAKAFFLTPDQVRVEAQLVIEELERTARAAENLPDDSQGTRSQASLLVDLAAAAELWHAPDGTAFATVQIDRHRETWNLRTKAFRDWLSYNFFLEKGQAPGGQALADALGVLSGKARFEGPGFPVFTRVAEVKGTLYMDLANSEWEAVEITASGWKITSDPPVRFRRPRGMLPLPTPIPGGDIGLLRPFLNLSTDQEWSLYLACLVQALRGHGPYPVLVVYGEHGTAKSTVALIYRRLVDPNLSDLRGPPRDERDLRIQATNSWVLGYDNLTGVSEWLSNALCRLSTGGGMGTRELYSDDEEVIFDGQRPSVLNGIEEIATRPDLVDRTVSLTLLPISPTDRRTEREFWAAFSAVHPYVLGGLFDAVVSGLRELSNVHIAELPRMADFAVWATACESGLGLAPGEFLGAYTANRSEANTAAVEY